MQKSFAFIDHHRDNLIGQIFEIELAGKSCSQQPGIVILMRKYFWVVTYGGRNSFDGMDSKIDFERRPGRDYFYQCLRSSFPQHSEKL